MPICGERAVYTIAISFSVLYYCFGELILLLRGDIGQAIYRSNDTNINYQWI